MVRCTKYWDKIIEFVKAGDQSAIEAFCQKDRFQTQLIVEHAAFMDKYADKYHLVVVGIPDPESPDQIKPSAESAFRNLRKAEREGDSATVEEVLSILKGQITMVDEDKQKPVTAREVNKVIAKVAPQYLAKADPTKKRLSIVLSPAEFKVFATRAVTLYPKETESRAVSLHAYRVMRDYIKGLKEKATSKAKAS